MVSTNSCMDGKAASEDQRCRRVVVKDNSHWHAIQRIERKVDLEHPDGLELVRAPTVFILACRSSDRASRPEDSGLKHDLDNDIPGRGK